MAEWGDRHPKLGDGVVIGGMGQCVRECQGWGGKMYLQELLQLGIQQDWLEGMRIYLFNQSFTIYCGKI